MAAERILFELPQKKARLVTLEQKVAQLDLEDLDKESLCSAASATLSKLRDGVSSHSTKACCYSD